MPGYIQFLPLKAVFFVWFSLASIVHADETGLLNKRPEPMVFDLVDPLGAKKARLKSTHFLIILTAPTSSDGHLKSNIRLWTGMRSSWNYPSKTQL
ncbi:hypothetical protein SAMN05428978_104314 [Nitrosomonas sp. Nm34]|nr:hypothetical protein SAMN05428978_104314 [Nitrosomonas sp. Nm34]